MSHSPRRPLIERLEDRRYAAAVNVYSSGMPLVWADDTKVLRVQGTAGNDDISLRRVGKAMHITITYSVSSGDAANGGIGTGILAGGLGKPIRLIRPDTIDTTYFNGSIAYTTSSTYVVPAGGYRSIEIHGGDGTDLARTRKIAWVPATTSVEKTVFDQVAAPEGSTPSDPADGAHFGPKSYWAKLKERQQRRADASQADLAFVGDSHVARYLTYGRRSWNEAFPKALDLGIPGDGTRQLLARIKDGLFDRYKPKTLVVMIGSNNFLDPSTSGTDDQIFAGVAKVMRELKRKLPNTKLILVGTLPRTAEWANVRIKALNAHMVDYAPRGGFRFVDIYDQFAGEPTRTDLMYRNDHLTPKGYRVLTNMLVPVLKTI